MKIQPRKILIALVSIVWSGLILAAPPPPAPASATLADVVTAINNLIGGYGNSRVQGYLTVQSPSASQTTAYGTEVGQVMQGMLIAPFPMINSSGTTIPQNQLSSSGTNAAPKTQADLIKAFSTTDPTSSMLNQINSECQKSSGSNITSVNVVNSNCMPQPISTSNSNNFDLSNLITPLAYSDGGNAAFSFAQLVAGLQDPYPFLDMNSSNFKSQLTQTGSVATALGYVFTARNFVASMTPGLSALYALIQERIPQEGLSIPALKIKKASPLQVDEYQSKERLIDPDWVKNIEAATPATVEREMLYILAEMRLEMFKTRMAIQQLNAIMAVQSLGINNYSGRQALQSQALAVNPPTPPISGTTPVAPTNPNNNGTLPSAGAPTIQSIQGGTSPTQ